MKIAINAQWYQAGQHTGIGTYTEYLYRNIWKLDNDKNQYIFFSKEPSEELIHFGGTKVNFRKAVSVEGNKYLRFIWENAILPAQINRINPDILHSVNYSLPWAISHRTKKIITVHDLIWMKFPEFFSKDTLYAAKKKFHHSCQASDAILTDSESTKSDIQQYFNCNGNKIIVTYLGVDHKKFGLVDISEPVERYILVKYNIPKRYILWIGDFRSNKNVDRLCRAFIKVKETLHCPHKLVLSGHNGYKYQRGKTALQQYKEFFVFTGAVEDNELPILYNLAEVFVFPSLYEGFGLPILEAMACGTPVITSNRSSLPEVAGDAAILVNPEDEDELAEAIMRLITNDSLRESLRKKGLERAKLFTWEGTARKTLKLFKEVTG